MYNIITNVRYTFGHKRTPEESLLPQGFCLYILKGKADLQAGAATVTCHRPAICICSLQLRLPVRTREMILCTLQDTPFRGWQPTLLYHKLNFLSNYSKICPLHLSRCRGHILYISKTYALISAPSSASFLRAFLTAPSACSSVRVPSWERITMLNATDFLPSAICLPL